MNDTEQTDEKGKEDEILNLIEIYSKIENNQS
jgi:hypothetical protein